MTIANAAAYVVTASAKPPLAAAGVSDFGFGDDGVLGVSDQAMSDGLDQAPSGCPKQDARKGRTAPASPAPRAEDAASAPISRSSPSSPARSADTGRRPGSRGASSRPPAALPASAAVSPRRCP